MPTLPFCKESNNAQEFSLENWKCQRRLLAKSLDTIIITPHSEINIRWMAAWKQWNTTDKRQKKYVLFINELQPANST